MPVFLYNDDQEFPDMARIDKNGIIALGGRLTQKRLQAAYSRGIFPWPHEGYPLLWFCPDPRYVITPPKFHIPRSLKKHLKQTDLIIKADTNFLSVIRQCQQISRKNQEGTWITENIVKSFRKFHTRGYAHSVEAYQNNTLVGGLYGVSIGSTFFGESMFTLIPNVSKICFVTLFAHLVTWNINLVDCQQHTQTLDNFGAHPISRDNFLSKLKANNNFSTKLGPWNFTMSPKEALEFLHRLETKNTPATSR